MRVSVRRRDGTTLPAKLDLRVLPRDDGGRYIVGLLEGVETGERATDRKPAASHCRRHGRCGRPRQGRVLVLAQPRAALAAECVRHVARRPRPRSAARQARQSRRSDQTQPRPSNAARQRPQRRRQVSSGGLEIRLERVDLVALVKRGLDAWQLLAIGQAARVAPPHRARSGAGRWRSRAAAAGSEPFARERDQQHPGRRPCRPACHATGGNCIVEVEDTGAALSAEDAAHLAVPLWRAPTAPRAVPVSASVSLSHITSPRSTAARCAATTGASGARFVLTLPLAASSAEAIRWSNRAVKGFPNVVRRRGSPGRAPRRRFPAGRAPAAASRESLARRAPWDLRSRALGLARAVRLAVVRRLKHSYASSPAALSPLQAVVPTRAKPPFHAAQPAKPLQFLEAPPKNRAHARRARAKNSSRARLGRWHEPCSTGNRDQVQR